MLVSGKGSARNLPNELSFSSLKLYEFGNIAVCNYKIIKKCTVRAHNNKLKKVKRRGMINNIIERKSYRIE